MADLRMFITHVIMSPLAYYLFGRPRITLWQYAEAYKNQNFVLKILCSAHWELQIAIRWLEPSEIRLKVARLVDELDTAINAIFSEWSAMCSFWRQYGGILSRRSLTEQMVVRGTDQFDFWTDGEARRTTALAKQEEVAEILEICELHVRQRRRVRRANGRGSGDE